MNERLGIFEERQATAAKYARFIAPRRLLPEPKKTVQPKPVEPEPEPRQEKRLRLSVFGKRTRIHHVVSAFCREFSVEGCPVTVDDILSPARSRRFARPRQAIMYFMHVKMGLTTTPVGKVLNRDHTTVLHAKNKVTTLLGDDEEFSARYHRAARAIRALWAEQ